LAQTAQLCINHRSLQLMAPTTSADREIPLIRRDQSDREEELVTVENLQSFIANAEVAPEPNQCRLRWAQLFNYLTLMVTLFAILALCFAIAKFLCAHFMTIWENGFVAALFLGGLVVCLKFVLQWLAINVIARFLFTTIKLSKETKEATPVLEWFKVWLPRMMKERGSAFRSIQPLFRKKDGSTFFSFFRDIRSKDKFELISWVTPGTHFFRYRSARLGGNIDVAMFYWTGEAKKEGWDQSLTVMESIVLTVFDPYSQAMPYLMEMLSEAQDRFAERDMACLRFQEWHGWKQMWESATPDECIAPNFKTLAFYPKALLSSIEKEVHEFLNAPNEVLLRAGLPLKLGFLFHGPPGTGKTNLVRYLAAKYQLPINIIDCNSGHMDNGQLLHAIVSAQGIVLMEDIDNLDAACGLVREKGMSLLGNKAQVNKSVTLDGLLNALDGVHRGTQKRILIATTNYPEKLIPSIRRRGRFGYSLKIDYPQDEEFSDMFKYYMPVLSRNEVIEGIRGIERSTGLRLATAAAIDIIAKLGLQNAKKEPSETVAHILQHVEISLRELQQSNRKSLHGTHELLTLLDLEKYANSFYKAGLVDMRYVKLLDSGELDGIGIKSLGDRKKLLDAFQYMEDTPPLAGDALTAAWEGLRIQRNRDPSVLIFQDLRQLLQDKFDEEVSVAILKAFESAGLADCTVPELKKLSDQDLEKMGVEKLGDRRRMLMQIEKLLVED